MKDNDLSNEFYKEFVSIIDTAFKIRSKEYIMQTQKAQTESTVTTQKPKYQTIEEYTQQTGKRFRMTKDQITRGISREEAFKEFINMLD